MGWPKGKPRKPQAIPDSREPVKPMKHVKWEMKAGNRWASPMEDDSGVDRFHISQDMIPDGMDLQWITDSVNGHPETQHRAAFEKRGWTPVHPSDFNGLFEGKYGPQGTEGEINVGGQVLMARPLALTIKARRKEFEEARTRVELKERALRGGDMPMSGADHPSAVRTNRINKTYERIEVPSDED